MLLWWRHCARPSLALQGDRFNLDPTKRDSDIKSGEAEVAFRYLKILHNGCAARTIKPSERTKEQ